MIVICVPQKSPVLILGHVFMGLDDIENHVEASCAYQRSRPFIDELEPNKRIKGLHVGECYENYPCFDSSDRMYENRSYQNFTFSHRPFTEHDMLTFSNLPCGNNTRLITFKTPSNLLPMVYYNGDSSVMLVAYSLNIFTVIKKWIGRFFCRK